MFLFSLRRGLLTSVQPGSAFVSAPALYIADHNTAPPVNQVVKTDPSSLLIKTLQKQVPKEDPKRKGARASDRGKRPAEGPAEGDPGNAAKRGPGVSGAGPSNAAGPSTSAAAGPSIPQPAEADYNRLRLQSKTVKDLQAILKAWGLPISGKKEDLVVRIMEKQEAAQGRR